MHEWKNNYNPFVRAADGEVLNTSSGFFIIYKYTDIQRAHVNHFDRESHQL